jgi:hypothetical protein
MNTHKTFSASSPNFFFQTTEGKLMCWGSNEFGSLGVGDTDSRSRLVPLPIPKQFYDNDPEIISMACSSYHTLAVTSDFRLLVWGRNNRGQLGLGDITHRTTPHQLTLPDSKRAISVSCGLEFSAALTTDGCVFAWGSNEKGQLGVGDTKDRLVPTQVSLLLGRIREISCGWQFMMALARDSTFYVWGHNYYGQLGLGDRQDRPKPALHPFTGISHVFAATRQAAVLNICGALFVWGNNYLGTLGTGDLKTRYKPHLLFPSGVSDVAFGGSQSMVLMEDRSMWVWGKNASQQLNVQGNGQSPEKLFLPEITGDDVAFFGSGSTNFYLINKAGDLWLWGDFLYAGRTGYTYTPVQIPQIHFRTPGDIKEQWRTVFRWIFLGRTDEPSPFSWLPIEIAFQMALALRN